MSNITQQRNNLIKEIKKLEEFIMEMERDTDRDASIVMKAYEKRLQLFEEYTNLEFEYPIEKFELYIIRQIEKNLQIEINHVKDFDKDTKAYYSNNKDGIVDLVIKDSNFSTIPEEICELRSLKKLALINNKIKFFPESFVNLVFLKELNLNMNLIEQLPEFFSEFTYLKKIILSNNKLSFLPKSFFTLKALSQLHLNNNKLQTIPDTISGLINLSTLSLNDNRLKELPSTISDLRNLYFLDLRNNLLT
ncbi:MAG TPA: leucine-rich repeat domain-containing protein, partial [bacterium]|nr:leucine-rich repeat domain-containing protein [bacterium]